MTPAKTSPSRLVWCLLVGGWSLVFAAPHFYWALGGRAGLGAQAAAANAALEQSWFAIYNLAAGCLGILGALVGAVLATTWGGRRVRLRLLVVATIACVVLLLRGALGLTLLLAGTVDDQAPVLVAIEPWFVLGGLAFGGMALSQRKKPAASSFPPH